LKQVALKEIDALATTLRSLFSSWQSTEDADVQANKPKVQVLEQLILNNNDALKPHNQLLFEEIAKNPHERWNKVLLHIGIITNEQGRTEMRIFHMKDVHPHGMLEKEWLSYLFQAPVTFSVLGEMSDFLKEKNPVLMYQHIPGRNISPLYEIYAKLAGQQASKFTVLHTSDEFGTDDIEFYANPSIKSVVRMYARPDLARFGDKVRLIPLGYANGRQSTGKVAPPFQERKHLWAFAGSADRHGRTEALALLKAHGPYEDKTKQEWSTPALLDGPAYTEMLRNAKFAPCFKGSCALESFRIYEALEHGAIPVYVPSESAHGKDELTDLFGKHPFLGFPSWQIAADMLPKLAEKPEVMEKHRTTLADWWMRKKAEVRIQIKSL
jgi:hypothetical protein